MQVSVKEIMLFVTNAAHLESKYVLVLIEYAFPVC
jgi:hypothetical protein